MFHPLPPPTGVTEETHRSGRFFFPSFYSSVVDSKCDLLARFGSDSFATQQLSFNQATTARVCLILFLKNNDKRINRLF